ncbi:Uncharacterised protein [Mycobacterium tuberculosis]|uniref:Uncharacterized protein n=1 Tax=Mycobacterium tuberculosis TaxID=1773 RepID=A0A0U0TMN7_MYCTX|nr:Uncharacterised protein [Mycobacterium tuberculosis]
MMMPPRIAPALLPPRRVYARWADCTSALASDCACAASVDAALA